MSPESDRPRLETILKYIDDIERIIQRHESIEKALLDIEGQYALMLCFIQIGELLNKIKSEEYKAMLPVKFAVGLRNIIVHNYDGIDVQIVKNTIVKSLPELKEKLCAILEHI